MSQLYVLKARNYIDITDAPYYLYEGPMTLEDAYIELQWQKQAIRSFRDVWIEPAPSRAYEVNGEIFLTFQSAARVAHRPLKVYPIN